MFGINPAWNNLDSLHRCISIGDRQYKTKPLKEEMEISFHKTFGDKKLSLLCYQISIAKPDIILFVTGPHYARSMEAGLMFDSNSLEISKPSMDKLISDISFAHSKG